MSAKAQDRDRVSLAAVVSRVVDEPIVGGQLHNAKHRDAVIYVSRRPKQGGPIVLAGLGCRCRKPRRHGKRSRPKARRGCCSDPAGQSYSAEQEDGRYGCRGCRERTRSQRSATSWVKHPFAAPANRAARLRVGTPLVGSRHNRRGTDRSVASRSTVAFHCPHSPSALEAPRRRRRGR